jgi:predicted  nucleic acid-binding Zn-ribbon protein
METLQTEWTSEDKTIQRLSDYKKMAADRIRDLEQRIDELEESLIAERQEVNRARRQFQIIKEIAELNS